MSKLYRSTSLNDSLKGTLNRGPKLGSRQHEASKKMTKEEKQVKG